MTVTDAKSRVAYYAAAYGVPVDIALAVAQRESGFNQSARGGSGEIGIMQLMPPTAAALGVNSYDAEANIEGGVRLLRDEYAYFGRWDYAVAAYNAGRARASQGPNAWPKSTQNYVASVVGLPPATGSSGTAGATGEWTEDVAPVEASLWGDVDPILLLGLAAAAIVAYLYYVD